MPDRAAMERHLQKCAYCAFVVEESKRLWQDVLAGIDTKDTARPAVAGITILEAVGGWTHFPQVPALAAKGIPGEVEPSSLTLASADRTVWLRVVRDANTRDVWLYLLSEGEGATAANVMLRPFGLHDVFITDQQGRVNLGPVPWPARDTVQAEVMFPKASFRLTEVHEQEQPTGRAILHSATGDEIHLSWTGEKRHRRLTVEIAHLSGMTADAPVKLAVRSVGQTRPMQVATIVPPGTAGLESEGELAALEIYIYQ
jgi:hypothetical protein